MIVQTSDSREHELLFYKSVESVSYLNVFERCLMFTKAVFIWLFSKILIEYFL